MNLAFSDFFFCCTTLLYLLVFTVTDVKEVKLLLKSFLSSCANISCLTVASISVDRLFLVMYPIKRRCWIKKKIIAVWISLIWFVSVSYSLKRFIFGVEKKHENVMYCSFLVALFSLTSVVYASVYIALKRKLRNRTELNEGSEQRNRTEDVSLLKEKKFLKTIILIASITFAGFGPWWTFFYMFEKKLLVRDNLGYWMLVTAFELFFLASFAINPLIYILRFHNYRKTFQVLYCRK